MGRKPRIPAQLRHRAFTLEEARALGLTPSVLRGKSYQRLGARLYRCKEAAVDTWALINAYRLTLPASAVLVGRTAAWAHGLDVEATNPIQVSAEGVHSRTGIDIRRSDVAGDTVEINGVPVASLERTLLDLCCWLPTVEALVVIDMAVRKELVSVDNLRRYAKRRAGAARLRALAEISAPAESPMETRLRWILINDGLPTPEVQTDLCDGQGRFVGRADLYYPSARLVIEFDGGNHRDRLVNDDRRQNSLIAAGYNILRFTAADVFGRPEAVVGLVQAALRR